MRTKALAVLLIAAALPSLALSAEPAEANACYRHASLLDPEASADERREHLARLQTAAGKESATAQHLLGTLFRLGPDHPARLLPHDEAQARLWLGKAARGGELYAMAALAEMDLAAGEPMDAMVWSQVMVLYTRRFPPKGSTRASEYAADLIFRSYQALAGRDPEAPRRRQSQATVQVLSKALDEEILANTNAFLARKGKVIDAAFRAEATEKDEPRSKNPDCPALHDNDRWPVELVHTAPGAHVVYLKASPGIARAGHGFFHVTVAPDGRVRKVLLVNSLPNAEYGERLLAAVNDLRFNAIEGAPERYALLPMNYSTGAVKLRN